MRDDGRTVIGPVVRDEAIVLDEIATADDLPAGWGAEAAPGRYRLPAETMRAVRPCGRADVAEALDVPAACPVPGRPPHRAGSPFAAVEPDPARSRFIGVRACELAALGIQDRVFLDGPAVDADYRARRASAFVVAVECATPDLDLLLHLDGHRPEVTAGFDVALTELDDGLRRPDRFRRRARRSSRARPAPWPIRRAVGRRPRSSPARAARWARPPDMSRRSRAASLAQPDHPALGGGRRAVPRLHELHARLPDLLLHQRRARRPTSTARPRPTERTWDTCFTDGFAKVAGGSFRPHGQDRYRQWLTHKFSTWWDQFGSSGCVGCGRCIAWCPVGIDVREELAVIAGVGPVRCRSAAAAPPGATRDPRRRPPRAGRARPGRATALGGYVTVHVDGTTRETADTVTLRLATDGPPPPRRRGPASS